MKHSENINLRHKETVVDNDFAWKIKEYGVGKLTKNLNLNKGVLSRCIHGKEIMSEKIYLKIKKKIDYIDESDIWNKLDKLGILKNTVEEIGKLLPEYLVYKGNNYYINFRKFAGINYAEYISTNNDVMEYKGNLLTFGDSDEEEVRYRILCFLIKNKLLSLNTEL